MRTPYASIAIITVGGAIHCGSTSDHARTAAPAPEPALGLTESVIATLTALSPANLPPSPADRTNRFSDDAAAARFGQRLFFEKRFSGRLVDSDNDGSPNALGKKGDVGQVSCAGCHLPSGGFSDTRSFEKSISLGAGWGRRRAPSILDVGQSRLVMWDGSRDSLQSQVFGPFESPVEYNSSRLFVAEQIYALHRAEYEAVFQTTMPPLSDASRFPQVDALTTGCADKDSQPTCTLPRRGVPGEDPAYDAMTEGDRDAVTTVIVNAGKAIAAYERKLTCGTSRFDAWMHGGATLSESEKRGAALFAGPLGCTNCHNGAFMSDEKFHNVGTRPDRVQGRVFIDDNDLGAFTGLTTALDDPTNSAGKWSDGADGRLPTEVPASLTGAFRTPKLRCVAARPSFMHTGQFRSLSVAMSAHARGGDFTGIPGSNELTSRIVPDGDIEALVAFLGALEGAGPPDDLKIPPP